MATTSKLSFRARNLDANRPMRVYFADELPDISECAPIARGVNPMPTGMEKEEEMESHLQHAIRGQQASTSGAKVDNHVIPTPKVAHVDGSRYNDIYPPQPQPKPQLIRVQAWLSMEREEAEYDLDSEDEAYLKDKPHINPRELERIVEALEAQSSENHICQPTTARKVLMPHFDDVVIDDVYDYWLAKRREAATNRTLGYGGLIARVRTECRKENAVLNPYVAFRRRAEKMQTRKNRKNDEDSYEKVLKLGHDLRRAVHLFEMVKRREKSKLAMLDLDAEILTARAQMGDFGSVVYNQILTKLRPEEAARASGASTLINGLSSSPATTSQEPQQPLREENGVKRRKMRKKPLTLGAPTGARAGLGPAYDRELPSKAWLKKNAEVWNQSPALFISGMGVVSPAAEVDQSVAAASTANADGRYAFKRRRGCAYKAAQPVRLKGRPSDLVPPYTRFYHVSAPSTSSATQEMSNENTTEPSDSSISLAAVASSSSTETTTTAMPPAAPATRPALLLRRRMGRGGRVVIDALCDHRHPQSVWSRVPPRHGYVAGRGNTVIYDPFELDEITIGDEEETCGGRLSARRDSAAAGLLPPPKAAAQRRWEMRRRSDPNRRNLQSEDEEELVEDGFGNPISSRFTFSSRHAKCVPFRNEQQEEEDAELEDQWMRSAPSPTPQPQLPPPLEQPRQEAPGGGKRRSPAKHLGPMNGSSNDLGGDASTSKSIAPVVNAVVPFLKTSSHRSITFPPGAGPSPPSEHDDDDGQQSHSTMEEDRRGGGRINGQSHDVAMDDDEGVEEEEDEAMDCGRPLEERAVGVISEQLQLKSGNDAAVLSPPDSAAPSPRVVTAADMVWRMRTKAVAMDQVVSRLNDGQHNEKDDKSSRESGCSPVDKISAGLIVHEAAAMRPSETAGILAAGSAWSLPREPSNSPSESNSSSDWAHQLPTTVPSTTQPAGHQNGCSAAARPDARLVVYATLSSEEESGARTGDHPTQPAKPPRKSSTLTGIEPTIKSESAVKVQSSSTTLPPPRNFPLTTSSLI